MKFPSPSSKRNRLRYGFSLVELLTVIAVVGILAAIVLPTLSRVFESAEENGFKRNAQNIAQVYNSARMAGASLPDGSDLDAVIQSLAQGVTGKGSLSSVTFQLGAIDQMQVTGAKQFLDWQPTQKMIYYTGAGGSGAN